MSAQFNVKMQCSKPRESGNEADWMLRRILVRRCGKVSFYVFVSFRQDMCNIVSHYYTATCIFCLSIYFVIDFNLFYVSFNHGLFFLWVFCFPFILYSMKSSEADFIIKSIIIQMHYHPSCGHSGWSHCLSSILWTWTFCICFFREKASFRLWS